MSDLEHSARELNDEATRTEQKWRDRSNRFFREIDLDFDRKGVELEST